MTVKPIEKVLSGKKRERQWRDGFHTDADGKQYSLDEMTTSHLSRTIILFKKQNLDTQPLEKERRKRAAMAKVDAVETVLAFLKSAERLEPNEKQRERARKARKLLSRYWDNL